ncbi:MAG: aminotransferase [Acidimicrobiia bacterium]|nr:aminotransferase [Acidimicrobiia bacterium]
MRLTDRTLLLTSSPIAEAHAWLAKRTSDRRLLDMSQAAPSYPTAPEIADRISEIAHAADGGRYAPPPGIPELNDAFAAELSVDYGASLTPSRVLPTGGCNQAFCVVTSTLTRPGDEVIMPVPYYFNHDMWLKLDGVTPVYLDTGSSLVPDPAEAASLITPRTAAIVLVTPGNPTGVTIGPDVISEFYELAVEHDLALVLDETYRNFRGLDEPPHDLFGRPGWADTVISLHSFSKDLAIPGYRVGAVVAGEDVLYEVLKLVDCVQISAPRIGQEAVIAGLRHASAWRREQAARIGRTQAAFEAVMSRRPGGFELASAGAFFGWVRHPFADLDTGEVIKRLVLDHDVLAIPGTAFTPTDDRWVRFSFANLDIVDLEEFEARLGEMG